MTSIFLLKSDATNHRAGRWLTSLQLESQVCSMNPGNNEQTLLETGFTILFFKERVVTHLLDTFGPVQCVEYEFGS